jgi:glycosyltransferase involved in cell wall biosynthesis
MKGNGYGYSMHNRLMRESVMRHGVEITKDAKVAVHITTPPSFEPFEDKINFLFTMYEALSLPEEWISKINLCDHLIVPCEWNKRLFGSYIGGKTIDVCPEGVEKVFSYKKREWKPGEKMIFLWIGASNERKGYRHVIDSWLLACEQNADFKHNAHLIMKTTQVTREERIFNKLNISIDTRDYTPEQMLSLYYMAHGFVFPSMGEGWGLTLHEAAATGVPCIYSHHSGMADFMRPEFGYPLHCKPKPIAVVRYGEDGRKELYNTTQALYPDIQKISNYLQAIYNDYATATERAEKQSDHVRKFTWDKAGKKLIDILKKRCPDALC